MHASKRRAARSAIHRHRPVRAAASRSVPTSIAAVVRVPRRHAAQPRSLALTPPRETEKHACRDGWLSRSPRTRYSCNMYNTQYRKFPSSTTRRRVSVFLLTQQQRSSQRNTENRPAAVLALARCPIGVAGTTMTTTVPCTVATGSTRHAAAAGPAREPSLARPPAVITSRMRLSPPIGPPTHPSLAGLWFVHWRHGQRCGGLCQERRRRPLR